MYGDTENAAQVLAAKLADRGVTDTALYDVSSTPVSQLVAELFKYSHVVLASVTYNLNIFPPMHNFLADLKMLNMEKLNALNFRSLHYHNALGTDLTVELPEGHVWEAGNDRTLSGQEFVANMPTEELFTSPLKTGVNGVVCASVPLAHDGNIIDGFRFTVKDGRITEVHARQGEEFLKAAVSVDEGASYFGEVALVPYDSPISNQKLLYYNTLFDENAACHIAFGEAYPCLKDGRKMTRDELKAHGLNDSITHVDFMVGTSDLSIMGTTHDGREIPVFTNGNFAL